MWAFIKIIKELAFEDNSKSYEISIDHDPRKDAFIKEIDKLVKDAPGSSSGRTTGSDPASGGSNPSPGTAD